MKWIPITITLFLISFVLKAQQYYISGRITEIDTNTPLSGASVYINNSTKGTTTNSNGEYKLDALQAGKYEIVVSFVGYNTVLYAAEIINNPLRISFQLELKQKDLRDVLILTSETRKRYLEQFKQNVLGYTNGARLCKINNISEVIFVAGKTKDEVLAYTENALVIDNPDLGYTIHFDLVGYYYNRQTTATYFYGYFRFEDWGNEEKVKKKWVRNRKRAYEGSIAHFFRSLANKNMKEQGFTVMQLLQRPKPKADTIANGTLSLRMEDGKPKMARTVTEDSILQLYSDSGYKVYQLQVADGLKVNYYKNTWLKTELKAKGMLPFTQPDVGTNAGLQPKDVKDITPILITQRGILLTPMSLLYNGVWAFERLVNMLPEDYEPENTVDE
jgi:hypothetical protein